MYDDHPTGRVIPPCGTTFQNSCSCILLSRVRVKKILTGKFLLPDEHGMEMAGTTLSRRIGSCEPQP